MHIETTILTVLGLILGFALLSKWLEKTIISLPIVFTAAGFLFSTQINDVAEMETLRAWAKLVAEVTLILVLFSDASHIKLSKLRAGYRIPMRMLIIGMPLTIAFGAVVAHLVSPDAGWAAALLVAAILTPTDAALGQVVVDSPDVPQKLAQAINVESGLNDGLALPVVLVAGSLSVIMGANAQSDFVPFTIKQIMLGPLAGIVMGMVTAQLMNSAESRHLIAESYKGVFFLITAFMAYFVAEFIGGNGFIAAFVGGAMFGNFHHNNDEFIGDFMEGNGRLLTMASFFIFGAVLLPDGLAHANWRTVSLAVAFLTIVRMVPIYVSLTGLGLLPREKLFLGWFGPRGLASVLFALLVVERFDIPGKEEILACVVLTVLISIVAHGISASPLAKRIGKMP